MRGYVYRRPVRRPRYSEFRRRLAFTLVIVGLFIAAGLYVYFGLKSNPKGHPKTAVESAQVNGSMQTFSNPYFKFQDTGKWVLNKKNTRSGRIEYDEYQGVLLQHRLFVFINKDPTPLDLSTDRVLPVRLVNDNSFQVTRVSSRCISQYAKGELHRVKEVTINGATMLCDPDATSYDVVISQINGDYRLKLRRLHGEFAQYVIVFRDNGYGDGPAEGSITNIASTFQAL